MRRPSHKHFISFFFLLFITTVPSLIIRSCTHKKKPILLNLSKMSSLPSSPPINLKYNLISSTSSRSRTTILKETGIPFTVHVSPVDERNIGTHLRKEGTLSSAGELVRLLAKHKATGVINDLQTGSFVPQSNESGSLILTCDQVVVHSKLGILEKPLTIGEAEEFFNAYREIPSLSTVGSIRLTHWPTLKTVTSNFIATVNFNKASLTADTKLLNNLIASSEGGLERLLSVAGGILIEHPAWKAHIEGIVGKEDAVMGLSIDTLLECVQEMDQLLLK